MSRESDRALGCWNYQQAFGTGRDTSALYNIGTYGITEHNVEGSGRA